MAKRSDRIKATAVNLQAGAADRTPHAVKELTVTLRPYKEVREKRGGGKEGRVLKMVGYLECHARVSGMAKPVDREIDVEVNEGAGPYGEIDQSVLPAVHVFLDIVKNQWTANEKEKKKVLGPDGLRPFADADGNSTMKRADVAARNAAGAAQRRAEKEKAQETPPIEPTPAQEVAHAS
jgi:hypothetical protein